MAAEDYGNPSGADDNQDIQDWISSYNASGTSAILNCSDAISDTSVAIDGVGTSADVREVYHAIILTLYDAYEDQVNAGTNMPDNMVMTKSTVKNVTTSATQSTQTHVYTFRIQENIDNNLTSPIQTQIDPTVTSASLPEELNT
jgi:hypothetical protein